MSSRESLADFDALPYDEQTRIITSGDDRLLERWGLVEFDPPLSG